MYNEAIQSVQDTNRIDLDKLTKHINKYFNTNFVFLLPAKRNYMNKMCCKYI